MFFFFLCKKMFTEMYFYPQLISDPSGGGKSWTSGPTGVAMTGSQQVQLQQIRDRDAEFDQDLDHDFDHDFDHGSRE